MSITLRTEAMKTVSRNQPVYWSRVHLPLTEQVAGPNNWIVLYISFSSAQCHECISFEPIEVAYSKDNEEQRMTSVLNGGSDKNLYFVSQTMIDEWMFIVLTFLW